MSDRIPDSMVVPRFIGGGEIRFAEKPVPLVRDGQLLVRIIANALCGSERHQFLDGTEVTPGHEAVGIVVESGPGAQTEVGTRGVVYLMDFCGVCRSCSLGFTNQCLDKRGDIGFNRDGGYGGFIAVNENVFFPVDEGIPLTEATMLLDIMGTTGHAIRRAQRLREDVQSVGIAGAGPIGLGMLAMAKILLGVEVPVVISDLVPYRLELAERLGGLVVNLEDQTLAAGIRGHGLETVDLAFDTSGRSVARRSYLDVLDKRGVLVCAGHGEDLKVEVTPDLIVPERAILGSEYFRYDELAPNLKVLREHRSYLRQILTHTYPLRDIQQAFEVFFGGETGKVVIEQ